MKRFRFRLQKLLDIAKQRERQSEIRLHDVLNKLEGQEKILHFLKDSLRQSQGEFADSGRDIINGGQIILYNNYFLAIKDRISYQTVKVNEVKEEVHNHRQALLAIQKDRKMLERLMEKDKEAHSSFVKKTEGKLLDDISIQRRFYCASHRADS